MSVCYEYVAIWSYQHIIWLVEQVISFPCNSGNAQAHEQFTLETELVNLVTSLALDVTSRIRYPNVPLGIDVDAMWPYKQAGAKALDNPAIGIYQQDRIDFRCVKAVAVAAAPFSCPNMTISGIVDRACCAPGPTIW